MLDNDGQPLNRLYGAKRLNDRAIDELIGLSKNQNQASYYSFIKGQPMKKTAFIAITLLLTISACATQRYGRLQAVTPSEANYLTCETIEIEIEKGNAFIKSTNDTDAEFTGKDVLAFLGDFGIGNSMEHTDAIKSATERLEDLTELKKQKGCVVTAGK